MNDAEIENVLSRAVEDRFDRLLKHEQSPADRQSIEYARSMTRRVTLDDVADTIVWGFLKKAGF
jgi:hypothetical protein